jgi:nucleotide-binding universal stress UspA family protein
MHHDASRASLRPVIFDRVVCGVDRSEESMVAARYAARLVEPDGRLLLVSVVEVDVAVHAGFGATAVLDELRSDAQDAVEAAHAEVASVRLADTRLLEGPVSSTLLAESERERATLLCMGTHGHRRATGIVLGSTVTTLVHEARMSVLVARTGPAEAPFPSSIVVGVDGSPEARAASEVASALARRFGASVRLVAATRGKSVDVEAVQRSHPGAEAVDGSPVDCLVSASEDADLMIVGSKGLHGVKALGSVSERVVHRARCSVLVARRS